MYASSRPPIPWPLCVCDLLPSAFSKRVTDVLKVNITIHDMLLMEFLLEKLASSTAEKHHIYWIQFLGSLVA